MEELPNKISSRHYLYFMAGQQFSILGLGIIGFVITWWITVETQSVMSIDHTISMAIAPIGALLV